MANTTRPYGNNINPVKLFGSNQPNLFGFSNSQPTTRFQTTTPVFGTCTFGTTPITQSNSLFTQKPVFSSGQPTLTNSQGTSLFGAKQPGTAFDSLSGAQPNLFGVPASQPFARLQTATPAFGVCAFGTTPVNQPGNLLAQKPVFSSGQPSFSFGQTTSTNSQGTSLFGAKQPVSGVQPSLFGIPTSQPSTRLQTATPTFWATPATQSSGMLKQKSMFGGGQSSFGSTQPNLFGIPVSQPSTGMQTITPAFGTNTFGIPPATQSSGMLKQKSMFGCGQSSFGSTQPSLFGVSTSQPSTRMQTVTPAFGTNTFDIPPATQSGGLLAQKPVFGGGQSSFGTTQPNLFGIPVSQPATGLQTVTPAFGACAFGTTPTTKSDGLFAQKSVFDGGQSSLNSFGQTPLNNNQGTSLFGAKPSGTVSGSSFGTTPVASTATAFSITPSLNMTNQNNSLFNNSMQPSSNISVNSAPNISTTFGADSNVFGNTINKTPSLVKNTNSGTDLVSSKGFGSSTDTQCTARTNPPMLESTLGGSTFSAGDFTQPSINLLNQQMALSYFPFGYNLLFKSLLPSSEKMDKLLKSVSAANHKNFLYDQNYKMNKASNVCKMKIKSTSAVNITKISLFEGLEDDPNYFQKMQMKPSIKRLNIQPKNRSTNKASPDLPSGLMLQPDSFTRNKNSPRYFTPLDSLSTTDSEIAKRKPVTLSPTVSSTTNAANKKEEKNTKQLLSLPNNSESDVCMFEPGFDKPHLSGIVLRRIGYYTIPSMDALADLVDPEGRCFIKNFTVGRYNYGNICFPDLFDVSGLNLDEIIHIRHKEVIVYPDEREKPAIGCGLNRMAQVTLDRVWPVNKITRQLISEPAQLYKMDYEQKLIQACIKMGAHFKEYRPATGSWVFKVNHFSK